MSIERARAHLKKYNLESRIQEFTVSSATVELAAKALNIEGARIAKTLSYMVDGGAVLVVQTATPSEKKITVAVPLGFRTVPII